MSVPQRSIRRSFNTDDAQREAIAVIVIGNLGTGEIGRKTGTAIGNEGIETGTRERTGTVIEATGTVSGIGERGSTAIEATGSEAEIGTGENLATDEIGVETIGMVKGHLMTAGLLAATRVWRPNPWAAVVDRENGDHPLLGSRSNHSLNP